VSIWTKVQLFKEPRFRFGMWCFFFNIWHSILLQYSTVTCISTIHE
jgi:hypothetical protein